MRSAIWLILATGLVGALVGCEPVYYDGHEKRSAYPWPGHGYSYHPSRTYYSRGDYYRHYNGIDG